MCIQISRRDYLSLIVFTKQTFIIIQGSVQFTESRKTLIMPFLETPAKCCISTFLCHLTFAHSLDWWCYFVFTRCLRRQITWFMRNWKLSPRVACGHFYIIMIFYGLVWIFSKKISKCIENSRRQGSSCLDSTWHCKKTHGKYCQYNSSCISIWVLWDTN